MTLPDLKIPGIHCFIARLLAENGGEFEGTNQLCQMVPASNSGVLHSLQHAERYQLIRKSQAGHSGRGHKSTWILTPRGWRYVQS